MLFWGGISNAMVKGKKVGEIQTTFQGTAAGCFSENKGRRKKTQDPGNEVSTIGKRFANSQEDGDRTF